MRAAHWMPIGVRMALVLAGVFASTGARSPRWDVAQALKDPSPPRKLVSSVAITLDGREQVLRELAGPHGLAIVFWAGWSERSIEALQRIDALYPRLKAGGLGVVAVSVEHQDMSPQVLAAIAAQAHRLNLQAPVVADRGLRLFGEAGVVAVPTTIVIDAEGTVIFTQSGYALEHRDEIVDALERRAGIAAPRPVASTPHAAPRALRYLQLGRTQVGAGHDEAARTSFETAVTADPSIADPLAELAALALDRDAVDEARALLARVLALDSVHPGGRIEQGRWLYATGRKDDAISAWLDQSSTVGDPLVHAYLAFTAGDAAARARHAERAVALGGPDPASVVGTQPVDPLRAMRAYRRALTAKRRWDSDR